MTEPVKDSTAPISIETEMRRSYLEYAMSVIVGRALPDVRDGLKPVHRRVLYAMHEMGNDWNKAHKKSARVVGDVIGKYHPHGDSAVYDTMVRMAQNFSLRYLLVDGQGNFGSVDGDPAAAMRYTEVRMTRFGHELLLDIEKETVDFGPNYDGHEQEPLLLPSRVPNLLVNGSSGIAVGMATNIPPHNLKEVINACFVLLKDPQTPIEELMGIVVAPDFPTRGLIYGLEGVREGYLTGRGRVVMRGRTHIEDLEKGGRQALIIDEIPYQVNKRVLIERIAELVNNKQIEGISETGLRDESDKQGMRIVLELKRGEMPEVVLNNLYKLTQLQDTFGINMVALVQGRPRLLNLKQMLELFLEHRREVVTRRCKFDLRNARARAHILEGFAVALSNVDEIIALIKKSATPAEAKTALMARPWSSQLVTKMVGEATNNYRPEGLASSFGLTAKGYYLSDAQTQAILELRLQRLTAMEQDKILKEYKEVLELIDDLVDILAKPARITAILVDELKEVNKQYGDERRSEIVANTSELTMESLVAKEDMLVTLSHGGYIKAMAMSDYRAQRRGGRGKQAASVKEDDFVERMFLANTHDHLLSFSSAGRLYWLRVYEVPQGSRQSRGKPVINLFPLQENERLSALLPVSRFEEDQFVFMATAMGAVKKISLSEFSRPRSSGIIALALQDGDRLIGAALTDGKCDVMLMSSAGKAVRFAEAEVRAMGRGAKGVRGMTLGKGERVINMLVVNGNEKGWTVLTATQNGYGKRTNLEEYTRHGRGTKGMIAIQTSQRNGPLVGAVLVKPEDQIMLISSAGVLIRTAVEHLRVLGRTTQGVTLIQLDSGTTLAGIEKVEESGEDEEEDK